MRLDKFTADALGVTRSEATKIIKSGKIFVDGHPEKSGAAQVGENTLVEFDGKPITREEFVYLMMNKPMGYLSATEDKNQKTVLDLLESKYKRCKLFPVGRLDKDTEGFLLLTNDGRLAHDVLSPKKKVGKTYYAKLSKPLDDNKIYILEKGVDIGGYVTMPCKVELLDEKEINITITEGKFHQVKKMLEAVDNSVVYLKRINFAGIELDEALKLGEYRQLCTKEMAKILRGIQ